MRVLALVLCLAAATTCASARDNNPPKVAARVLGKVAKFGVRMLFRTAKTAISVAEHAAVGGLKLAADGRVMRPAIAALAEAHSGIGTAARTAVAIRTVLDVNRLIRRTRADDATVDLKLLAPLLDETPDVRRMAVQELGKLGTRVAHESIIKMLDAPCFEVREAAVLYLGEMKSQAAVEPLIGLLKGPDLRLKLAAAKALGSIGDSHATDALKSALDDDPVRPAAQESLDTIPLNAAKQE